MRTEARMPQDGSGYVYALTNPAFPGQLKIGMTRQDRVAKRVAQMQTGVPAPFSIAWSERVSNPPMMERLLHEYFADERTQGEWFRVELPAVIAAAHQINDEIRIRNAQKLAQLEFEPFEKPFKRYVILFLFGATSQVVLCILLALALGLSPLMGLTYAVTLVTMPIPAAPGLMLGDWIWKSIHSGELAAKRAELCAKHGITAF